MVSTPGPNPAHRSVANIRAGGAGGGRAAVASQDPLSPTGSPHTPLRGMSSAFASPSSLRAEEDTVVIELGARRVRVGFAGDPASKATVEFGPEHMRRVGDFRAWDLSQQQQPHHQHHETVGDWHVDRELWRLDVRGLDLGLVADKFERGLRDAFSRHLLVDSRPRKVALVLPPAMPLPLLSTILDALFNRFQSPQVSLLSSPVMAAAAAGVRSGLVIDIGWAETVVTSIYEFREVNCTRSVRAGRALVEQTHTLLVQALQAASPEATPEATLDGSPLKRAVSFAECEAVACRAVWCRPAHGSARERPSNTDGLPTVAEEREDDEPGPGQAESFDINLTSTHPPTTLRLPFDRLSDPCEDAFFDTAYARASFDDHEQPLHILVYKHLVKLPVDVRAICMSRVIFTGGCSAVLGLRSRIVDELTTLVRERGWDPVWGRPPLSAAPNWRRPGPDPGPPPTDGPAHAPPPTDPVEAQVKRSSNVDTKKQRDAAAAARHGDLRVVGSLGPWAGASLVAHLKIPAVAAVDRDLWLAHGAAGAGRAADVDPKAAAQQRQSMGPSAIMAMRSTSGSGGPVAANWTLGAWGTL